MAKLSPSAFPGTDDSVITEQFDLSSSFNHSATLPRQTSKNKNVTFDDDVMMAEISDSEQDQSRDTVPRRDIAPHESSQCRNNFTVHDNQNGYSAPYGSCPAISYPSDEAPLYNSPRGSSNNSSNSRPSSYKDTPPYLSPSPWSPDSRTDYSVTVPQNTPRRTGESETDYSVNVPQSTPRRTVRDVKAKDRSKRLDSLAAMHANVQTMQSDPDLCQNYDSNRPYDFTDSNSLLKYKMHGTDDSTSELNSAASTTSGTYIIQTGELQCDCNHDN